MLRTYFLRPFLRIVLPAFMLYVLGILGHGWLVDWQPEPETVLTPTSSVRVSRIQDSLLTFISWNVGYGGLGAESDFFYDDEGMWHSGSSMVRTPRPLVEKNLSGALDFLKNTQADFFLLQEVDMASDRSHQIRQYDAYCAALPGFAATFAANYQCPRVPIPLLEPWNAYGAVESGLGTFGRYQPAEAVRYQLPGKYPMPDRLFQLDRCAALHRYPTKWGNDLVVINIHNSAYDPGDKIKAIQMPYLRGLALKEYEKGNYVVLGGDWNQCPPYFRYDTFIPSDGHTQGNIPDDFFPEGWKFAYDSTLPTNRKAGDPYEKGKTFETLIDFFLVSPNVRVVKVNGISQKFQFSDHQPVVLTIGIGN